MPRTPRRSYSTRLARELRKTMTPEERLLWRELRNLERKRRRQEPIGSYIVDFVDYRDRLVVELDGSQHVDSDYDRLRDEWLRSRGFVVLRFPNNEIWNEMDAVLDTIGLAILERRRG